MTEGLLILCLAIGISIIVIPLAFWLEARRDSSFIISFEEFHECYMICPDVFTLHNGWARYTFTGDDSAWHSYAIGFGFISWIKYCLWRKIGLNIEKKKKLNKNYKDFMIRMQNGGK